MLKAFQTFIKSEQLFKPSDKILLTVSGGVDSVVMCELFYQSKLKFGVAHCNFGLRGKESDGENQSFVKKISTKIPSTILQKQISH